MGVNIDFEPVGLRGQCNSGISVLECARHLGVDLVNLCGGNGTCGQCLVQIVEGNVSPLTKNRENFLTAGQIKKGYCLACKTIPLSDLKVAVPPGSLTTPQRTQVESINLHVVPEPMVKLYDIEMIPPSSDDLCSDSRRLMKQLKEKYGIENLHIGLEVLRELPVYLRNNKWKGRVVVRENEIIALARENAKLSGIAFDIGTTKIAAYLLDLETGRTLASKGMMNPQIKYGEDIIARLLYAQESPKQAANIRETLVHTLNLMIADLCTSAGLQIEDVFEVAVVCNTAIHHLFLGLPGKSLSLAPYTAVTDSQLNIKSGELGLKIAKGAYVYFLPNIAGFVGADHVAMLTGIEILNKNGVVIALDIGTNTEICLSNKGRLTSLSCASGPAFEGAHVKCGMRAGNGAIERLRIENNEIIYQTIGRKPAKGFCGSGILDVFAQLYKAGIMDRTGKLAAHHPMIRNTNRLKEFIIPIKEPDETGCFELTFSQKDIREIQLAKGAVRTGIQALLKADNLNEKDIDEIIIAGAFGSYINVESAKTAGMLPDIPSDRFTQVGNAAGLGSRLALISKTKREQAVMIARQVEYLELAAFPDFLEIFAKSMFLA